MIGLSLLCTAAFASDFSGWQAGADIGTEQWREKTKDQIVTLASPGANVSQSLTNKRVGVHAGFDTPVAAIVLGWEAHFALLTGSATTTFPPEDFGYVLKPRWQAALDLRAGVVSHGTLLYITTGPTVSGAARTYFDHSNFYGTVADDRIKKTFRGFSYGAGIERRLTDQLRGQLAYRHSTYSHVNDYPSTFNHPLATPPDQYFETHTAKTDTLTFGLSYAF